MPWGSIRAGVRRVLRLPLRTSRHARVDVDEELEAFLAERIDYLMARGMTLADARAEALRRLGQPYDETTELLHTSATTRERRMRVRDAVSDFTQDAQYAARTLRRDAGFTAFAAAIIGLGIAASVIVFSIANALLVRPLPFREPDRLVWIANGGDAGLSGQTVQVGHMVDFTAQSKSYSDIAGYFAFYSAGDTKLSGTGGESIRLSDVPVTQTFFPMLGVTPVIGRNFSAAECAWNGPKAVLISHALWTQRFASDPSIVGRPITLNDASVTVVGVLPRSFDFGSVFAPGMRIDLFTPMPLTAETNRWGNTVSIIGRLKPGVTMSSAAAELNVLAPQIEKANPNRNEFKPVLTELRDHVSGRTKGALEALMLAVSVVMLIVCANLSNLLLARGNTRQKEMAIRAALGAGRRRLVRQMLTESVALSAGGALLGLVLAFAGTRAIAHTSAVSLPLLDQVQLDASALLFTVVLALATGLAFGMVPALQIPNAALSDALKVSGRTATHGKRGHAIRRSLVISEIALACVLLVGSGLLMRSFLNVLDVDLGFRPEKVAALRVDPSNEQRSSSERFNVYLSDVLRLVRGIPGVQSAGASDRLPLGGNRSWGVRVKGQTYGKNDWVGTLVYVVSENYISTMGMRLRAGRDLTEQDTRASEPVILINETLAKTLFPTESAIDKVIQTDTQRRVVGVVADSRQLALETNDGPTMFIPIRQTGDFPAVNVAVRTRLAPSAVATSIRAALASVSPNLPTNEIRTLGDVVDRAVSPRRFFTVLLGAFAVFSLILALLGIYGVISYTVSNRTQEIGVRIAVGASAGHIQARIIRETLGLALAGMLLGTLGSWIAARALGGLLFGVSANDPITFMGMLVSITVVALASGYLPARRASRIDPIVALRSS